MACALSASCHSQAFKGGGPIVFVHGGCHGEFWSWVHFLPYFAQAGWDCHALNWFGHNGSAPHPEVGLLQRGIADVTEEIAHVAGQFEESPVIVAHSMGALAAQKYAECHPVSALVLLTPVVPTEVGGDVIDLPIDPNQPWVPPPFEIARDLWFQGLEEERGRLYSKALYRVHRHGEVVHLDGGAHAGKW